MVIDHQVVKTRTTHAVGLLGLENEARAAAIDSFMATVDLKRRKPEQREVAGQREAKIYIDACGYPENFDYVWAAELVEHKGPGFAGKRFLEIGPGPGGLLREALAAGAAHVTGVDASAYTIRHLEKLLAPHIDEGRVTLVKGKVYDLPEITDGRTEVMYAQNTFHQFRNPGRALEAAVQALAPGGMAMFSDFDRGISKETLRARIEWTKPEIWGLLADSVCAALTREEFKAYLGRIPGIDYEVAPMGDPLKLSQRAREAAFADPVTHYKDHPLLQLVTVRKPAGMAVRYS